MFDQAQISHGKVCWGLYKVFYAVANAGSFNGAAQTLGVTQPTVGRQIRMLEEALEVRVLDRTQYGCVLTDAGRAVFDLCEKMAGSAIEIEQTAMGQDASLDGTVRITASEGFAEHWLVPRLGKVRQSLPTINLELNATAAAVDLEKREADIAFRIGDPKSDDLVGRRISGLDFGLFGSTDYIQRNPSIEGFADLKNHQIIESTGQIGNFAQAKLLRQHAKDAHVSASFDKIGCQLMALRSGMGLLALPIYIAKNIPNIQRVLPQDFRLELDLWLLVHPNSRSVARVNAVFQELCTMAAGSLKV